MATLNIRALRNDIKEYLEHDRNVLGMSQREYIERLILLEHEKLKDEKYVLKILKEKNENS